MSRTPEVISNSLGKGKYEFAKQIRDNIIEIALRYSPSSSIEAPRKDLGRQMEYAFTKIFDRSELGNELTPLISGGSYSDSIKIFLFDQKTGEILRFKAPRSDKYGFEILQIHVNEIFHNIKVDNLYSDLKKLVTNSCSAELPDNFVKLFNNPGYDPVIRFDYDDTTLEPFCELRFIPNETLLNS